MSFSHFFHAAGLRIHAPSQPLSRELSSNESVQNRSAWVQEVLDVSNKGLVFYDEQLSVYLSVRLDDHSQEHEDQPSEELLSFLSHLQVTLETSYISHLPASPSPSPQHAATFASSYFPSTPTGVPSTPPYSTPSSNRLQPNSITLGLPPRVSGRLSPLGVPSQNQSLAPGTPFPTPGVATIDEKRYARSEGVHAWSTNWNPEGGAEGERKYIVLCREETGGWVAVWELEAPVAFMKTRIQDPVFCLTASITLREKPNEGVILGYTSFSQNPSRIDLSPDQQPLVGQDDLEDVDLLGGLVKGLTFPSTRLQIQHARPSHSVAQSVSFPEGPHQGPKVIPPVSLVDLPTLRKSFRAIFTLASGLSLRMRTVYLPNLLTARRKLSEEVGDEEDEEERKIVISVEVEPTGGVSGEGEFSCGFEVESVDVKVGGGATQVELLEHHSLEEEEDDGAEGQSTFPLALEPLDQFNFLYVVSMRNLEEPFNPPPTVAPPALSSSNGPGHRRQPSIVPPSSSKPAERPVSISVIGRPFTLGPSEPGSSSRPKTYLSSSFSSKWNCVLDLTHLDNGLINRRLSVPALARIQPPPALRPASTHIAGNARYSIANLASLAETQTPDLFPAHPQSYVPVHPINPYPVLPQPTPAFPSYPLNQQQPVLPPSQLASTGLTVPRSRLSTQPLHEEEGLLISVNVLPSHEQEGEEKGWKSHVVRPLEPFTLEVFVYNKSDRVRRFVVGVPEKRRRRPVGSNEVEGRTIQEEKDYAEGGGGVHYLQTRLAEHLSSTTPLISLENNIRVGPLLPQASQSVRMKFLALTEGVFSVDTLAIIGIGEAFAVNLKSVCNIIVKQK